MRRRRGTTHHANDGKGRPETVEERPKSLNELPEDSYLRSCEVQERFKIPTSTLYRWMDRGEFPRPFKPTRGGTNRWRVGDLLRWKEQREAESAN